MSKRFLYIKLIFAREGVQLNKLLRDGIKISVDGRVINVKLRVTCGIFYLPAKAAMLNMMEKGLLDVFHIEMASLLCEHMNVLDCMENGTVKKPVKGFKGISGLTF
ncbi:hypothetical protein KUTeg_006707 [Tegillarca granosa]|uniref:Uncharacterized protein n=1 Tax=Tegillarca granosa TaxID=220873 RepID=A0ABQ9FB34_TEGGR|nr:hypothetical protein KUTeg_006707 [Tegillarca granosa]